MRRILKEIALATWLPATAGAITFAVTWLVWFVADPICVPMPDAPCPRLPWGRYITTAILGECLFHTFLVTSITGGSDIMLFIREFRNREKEQAAAAARLEREKELNKQQRAEDLKRYDQMHEQMLERLERSEAMTQQLIQQAAAERAADRQLIRDALDRFADAIDERNRSRRHRRSNLRNTNGSANP